MHCATHYVLPRLNFIDILCLRFGCTIELEDKFIILQKSFDLYFHNRLSTGVNQIFLFFWPQSQ